MSEKRFTATIPKSPTGVVLTFLETVLTVRMVGRVSWHGGLGPDGAAGV